MNFLDNRFYDNVIGEMSAFFEQNGFKAQEDGSFLSVAKKVLVEYNEERQMYLLKIAEVENGEAGEYAEAEAWLFDDTQNAKDAASVGIEFTATLREKMGIKIKRAIDIEDVALPTATKSGNTNMNGFAKRVLDIYPAFKDDYKEHVSTYGNILYLDFFGATLVPEGKRILEANEKKAVKKLYELLEEMFIKGDRETVNAAVAVAAAVAYKDEKIKENLFAALESNRLFYDSVRNFLPVFSKNKKLISLLIK